jgi:hypothetical protein
MTSPSRDWENSPARSYREAVAHVERPTPEQIRNFARQVSCEHSWYKHLPLDPAVPFVFYLDPEAGRRLVRTGSDDVAFVDVTVDSRGPRGDWGTTREYRERFGHWSYHAPYGSAFLFAGEGGTVDTAGPGLRILTAYGDWLELPESLSEAGRVDLTALVHPDRNEMIWCQRAPASGLTPFLRSILDRLPNELRMAVQDAADRIEETGANPILNTIAFTDVLDPLRPHLDEVHREARESQVDEMVQAMLRFLTVLDA